MQEVFAMSHPRPAPHVAAIHDLSGMGRCALTIVLPVLSAMGCWTSPLLTAWLSAHTLYPHTDHFLVRDLTEELDQTTQHWTELGASFNAVYSGFVGSRQQIDLVEGFIDRFGSGALVVVDPVMADHGKPYRTYTPEMCQAMKGLCAKADLITPNLTEAAILLDKPYEAVPTDEQELHAWLEGLSLDGSRSVILTGVSPRPGKIGAASLDRDTGEISVALADEVPAAFPGTGDLFTSVALGALLQEQDLEQATALAVEFVGLCARHTLELGTPREQGVQFEDLLGELI